MQAVQSGAETVVLSELASLDTWNQPRTNDELQAFIKRRHQALESVVDDDDDDEEIAI